MMENHFIESGESTFLALNLLVHFRESLHEIRRESLLSEKLFDRAPAGFSRESALGALPNGAFTSHARAISSLHGHHVAQLACGLITYLSHMKHMSCCH